MIGNALVLALLTVSAPADDGRHAPRAEAALLLGEIAQEFAARERFEAAEAITHRSLRLLESELGPEHVEVGLALFRLGTYAVEQGLWRVAEVRFRASLPITNAAFGRSEDVAVLLAGFAAVEIERSDDLAAKTLFQRAIELREMSRGRGEAHARSWLVEVGKIDERGGRWAEARACYERAFRARADDVTALALWRVAARQGNEAAADAFLARYAGVRKSGRDDDWSGRLVAFLTGGLAEEGLLLAAAQDAATRRERLCEAYFYIGSRSLARGDVLAAEARFLQSAATNATFVPEHAMALAALGTSGAALRVTVVETDSAPDN